MKKILKLAVVTVAAVLLNSCCGCDAPKFNAKEYAKNKTERLDKLVELTDAQEKEVYNLYLAQGKEMKKNMAAAKKSCGDIKCPDSKACDKKGECAKKAECNKPCDKKGECAKKAECTKPCDKKAECNKPCDKKGECAKKAECNKPCDKKGECAKKAECTKPCDKKGECAKKAECNKPCDKKGECAKKAEFTKPHKRRIAHDFVSPETKKATVEQIRNILTEEQNAKLRERFIKHRQFAPKAKECAATPAINNK